MTTKLNTLVLASLALLAMSAMAASAAQAAPGELHSEVEAVKTSAVLTGQNVGAHQMVFKGLTLQCQIAKLEGTVQKTTTDATLTPQYTGCVLSGLAAEVRMNGCKYTYTGVANFTANIDIAGCTSGKKIEIEDTLCRIYIPEQKNLSHAVFVNNAGPPKDIDVKDTVSGITYEGENRFGSGCMEAAGHHADATLTGTTTVKAYEDLGLGALTKHNGHEYQPFLEGIQVNLFAT